MQAALIPLCETFFSGDAAPFGLDATILTVGAGCSGACKLPDGGVAKFD